jgi:hypothetical protein
MLERPALRQRARSQVMRAAKRLRG